MGTRHLTVMQNYKGEEIVVMYGQWDGYPEGHGQELVDFLKDIEMVNGIPFSEEPRKLANGPECLAGQIVVHFKDAVGNFYLYPAGTRDVGEEYIYFVKPEGVNRGITVTVLDVYTGAEQVLMC